jgi:Family of unknown function (DUF6058)
MTPADDAYVSAHFVTLDELCANRAETSAAVRVSMLEGRLPLPSYLRSDGAEMVPSDYFSLADKAGGMAELPGWFMNHWADREHAVAEWRAYLDGQYVCLRAVSPWAMQRKDQLTAEISDALACPEGHSREWLDRLHRLVDQLDSLIMDFTSYDRLRFGGPVSRDALIDAVRAAYPRLA